VPGTANPVRGDKKEETILRIAITAIIVRKLTANEEGNNKNTIPNISY
jgi:hypothetical protein